MDILGTILFPIKWVIEAILVGFHTLLTALGMDAAAGLTWVLSIVGLVLVVRAALIPIFVRQIKSQRKMLEVAPQLKKIQDKYKGKKDQFSREAMQRETMELYQQGRHQPVQLVPAAAHPDADLLQPVLGAERGQGDADGNFKAGVGFLTKELNEQFGSSSLFDIAPLKHSIQSALAVSPPEIVVVIIAAVMVVIMTATQFITQLQIMSKNQSPEMKASPMYRQQRILLYILPLVFAFSGFAFPIGVMFYWLTSNIWTMVQQFIVIRNMPTPGSEAALAREARLAKRNRNKMSDDAEALAEAAEEEPKKPVTTQRSSRSARTGRRRAGARSDERRAPRSTARTSSTCRRTRWQPSEHGDRRPTRTHRRRADRTGARRRGRPRGGLHRGAARHRRPRRRHRHRRAGGSCVHLGDRDRRREPASAVEARHRDGAAGAHPARGPEPHRPVLAAHPRRRRIA